MADFTKIWIGAWGTGADNTSDARDNLWLEIWVDVVAPNQDTTGKSAETDALNSATTTIDVSSATAPTTWQVLTATSSTAATWQDAWGGGWGGFNPRFPVDITSWFNAINETINISNTYTVPTWKVLYITQMSWTATFARMEISGVSCAYFWNNASADIVLNLAVPLLVSAWEDVESSNNLVIHWFTCDENTDVDVVYWTSSYTVPTWKVFIVSQIYKTATTTFNINGVASWGTWELNDGESDISMNTLHDPIFLNAGEIFNNTNVANVNYFWYLVPDDFSI